MSCIKEVTFEASKVEFEEVFLVLSEWAKWDISGCGCWRRDGDGVGGVTSLGCFCDLGSTSNLHSPTYSGRTPVIPERPVGFRSD